MNRWYTIFYLAVMSMGVNPLLADTLTTAPKNEIQRVLDKKIKPFSSSIPNKKMVWFRYKDEPLVNVVNDLAAKRGINIMLPQGPNTLTTKVTFELPHKITLNRAWQYLITLLNISGFSLVPNEEFSMIIKNDKNSISKEPLPLYINVPPDKLPNTDLKIRYLRYLTNLQVPGVGTTAQSGNDLEKLINDMLSDTGSRLWEPQLNGLLLIDSSRIIKSVMTVVEELDASVSIEKPTFITLKHTSALTVKSLFDELASGISSSGAAPSFSPTAQKGAVSGAGYFTKGTRIIAENRTNSLIVLGKKDAVKRIVECIENYIDVPLDSGKSVLHIYDLQYLKASNFAVTLSAIVSNTSSGTGTGQSTSTGQTTGEQYFKGVKIVPESQGSGSSQAGTAGAESVQGKAQSGNRLIIACTTQDWIRIKKLIRELDKPQLQVMIHALIVDLSFTALRELNSQIRNNKDMFLKNVNWQTGHIGGIENEMTGVDTKPTNTDALMANLLPSADTSSTATTGNMASNSTAGNFILSCKDPKTNGIWWLTQIISKDDDNKVLSQPFLITLNNQLVYTKNTESRLIDGAATEQYGLSRKEKETKSADITLSCLPRINTNNSINISIVVDINEWVSLASTDTNNRKVTTNVNLKSGDILILGGLSKTKVEHTINKTPLFGDIPLIGNLFRSKNKAVTKSNLMVFLRPQIVGLDDNVSTERMFRKAQRLLSEKDENFSLLKDPITRWFFGKESRGASPQVISDFREETENINELLRKERNKSAFAPMPKPRENLSERKIPEITKLDKPSERAALNQQELDNEEQQAAEELKRLFGWDDENAQPTAQSSAPRRIVPEHELGHNTQVSSPALESNETMEALKFSKEQEAEAAEELKKILAENPDLAKAFEG